MKGIVFTEFLEMVEAKFSAEMVDDILNDANPASGGAYTAVGIYDHQELVDIVVSLSKHSGIPVPDLIKTFGRHLFTVFSTNYRIFFENVPDAFSFLYGIDDVIHAEVMKLYPDANLPKFQCEREGNTLLMTYTSDRHLADLAEGLILGSAEYFGEAIALKRDELDENSTLFTLTRH
jgi:Haem-NO-binding